MDPASNRVSEHAETDRQGSGLGQRMRVRLRHVDVDELIADYNAGTIVTELCKQHRIGLSTLYRLLDEHHIERRRPNNRVRTPKAVQVKVATDYQAGIPIKVIAERHGVSYSNVSNIGRRHHQQRNSVRRRTELIDLAVIWMLGGALDRNKRVALNTIGLATRLPGLQALAHVDPELQPAIASRLAAELLARWPTAT